MFAFLMPFLSVKNLGIALAVILLAIGLYIKGRSDGANNVRLEYAEEKLAWEKQINDAQAKLNTSVQDTLKDYLKNSVTTKEVIKYVKSKPTVITKYIKDDKCQISNNFVNIHNKAVDSKSLGELTDNTDDGVSNIKLSDVAATITVNYYQYNEMKTKLEALQTIVKKYKQQQSNLIGTSNE